MKKPMLIILCLLSLSGFAQEDDSSFFEGELIYDFNYSLDTSKIESYRLKSLMGKLEELDSVSFIVKESNYLSDFGQKQRLIMLARECRAFLFEEGSRTMSVQEYGLDSFPIFNPIVDTTYTKISSDTFQVEYSIGFMKQKFTYSKALPKTMVNLQFFPDPLNSCKKSLYNIPFSMELEVSIRADSVQLLYKYSYKLARLLKTTVNSDLFKIPPYKETRKQKRENKGKSNKEYRLKKPYRFEPF